ncbi:uncharacterized protein [Miscanthus floridulus]|uniref:uncharacterized protein n=1 Tax=Miscanthus floridulus TaxID=154761 RepID=UPI0034588FF2
MPQLRPLRLGLRSTPPSFRLWRHEVIPCHHGTPTWPNPSGAARHHHARAGFPVASAGHRAIVGFTADSRTGRGRRRAVPERAAATATPIISVRAVNQTYNSSTK